MTSAAAVATTSVSSPTERSRNRGRGWAGGGGGAVGGAVGGGGGGSNSGSVMRSSLRDAAVWILCTGDELVVSPTQAVHRKRTASLDTMTGMELTRADGSPLRVLVVDDEVNIAELVSMALRYEGWQVAM